jgi:hypothetical protein
MREASGNREAAGEHSPKRDHTGACVTSDDAANSPGHANSRAAEHHWRFDLGSRMRVRLYAARSQFLT